MRRTAKLYLSLGTALGCLAAPGSVAARDDHLHMRAETPRLADAGIASVGDIGVRRASGRLDAIVGHKLAYSQPVEPAQQNATTGEATPGSTEPRSGAERFPGGEDIIVTARRRAESLEKVPVAVVALSGAKLDQLVINTVQDLNKISGLTTSSCTYGRECFEPALRGQGTSFSTGQASVIPYFAEVAGFEPSYFDLESLQVVKGPQGTLFGETATGGVLLFEPRKPGNDFSGYLDVQGGRLDYHQFEGAIGGPIIEDKLMFRVAGQYRKRDGFTKGIPSFGGPTTMLDNIDKKQWRISLTAKPTENLEVYLLYAGRRTKSNGDSSPLVYVDPRFVNPAIRDVPLSLVPSLAAGFEFATGTPPPRGMSYAQLLQAALVKQNAAGARTMFYNFDHHNSSKFDGVIGQVKWDINDAFTLKNVFGMFWSSLKGTGTEQDAVDLPILDVRGRFTQGTTSITTGDRPSIGGYPDRSWRNETQLFGKLFDDKLTVQTGFYYRQNRIRNFRENGGFLLAFGNPIADPLPAATCAALAVASPCSSMTRSASKSYAGYAQATFAATDRLNLTAGFRRTWASNYNELTATQPYFVNATSAYFPGLVFPQAVPVTGRDPLPGAGIIRTSAPNERVNTYTLTADWQVTDSVLVYATRRKGYKGGGVNGNAPVESAFRTFTPETLEDFEIGAKTRFDLGGISGRASVAAYRDNYDDVQRIVILPGGGGQTLTSNVASARIQGIEFEGSVTLAQWLQVSGNFTVTDAKYKEWKESTSCSATFYYQSCTGLPGTTPVLIDHANGTIDIGSKRVNYKPDLYGDTSKYMWAVQPSLRLQQWIGEDISLTGNIYHKSRFIGANNPSNNAMIADIAPLTQQSVLGPITSPYSRPGFTIADLRFDWRNINGSDFSLSGVATNIANKKYIISGASAFSLTGTVSGQMAEPRLWYLQLRYVFGAK